MKRLVYLICMLVCMEAHGQLPKEQVLAHVDELKNTVGEKYWPAFNLPEYALEMNYHEDGPFRMELVKGEGGAPWRMECSSPEITFKTIPDVETYEEWYAMLLHECFHAFQHKRYPACWDRFVETGPQDFYATDSLKALRAHYDWYAERLSRENGLLQQMLGAESLDDVKPLFRAFMGIRNERLALVKENLGLDLTVHYPILEAIEGSARYIEYCLYKEQGINEKTDWMFDLDGSYYYASGFYLILIMKKFGIPFKDELFGTYFTLTEVLAQYM